MEPDTELGTAGVFNWFIQAMGALEIDVNADDPTSDRAKKGVEYPCPRCAGVGMVNWVNEWGSNRDVPCKWCEGTGTRKAIRTERVPNRAYVEQELGTERWRIVLPPETRHGTPVETRGLLAPDFIETMRTIVDLCAFKNGR